MNLEELQSRVRAGKRVRFVFFWSHRQKRGGAVGAECLSQWYPAAFEEGGIRYPTAEHYLMAEKARLFADADKRGKILDAGSPGAAKALGREVRGFREELWVRER